MDQESKINIRSPLPYCIQYGHNSPPEYARERFKPSKDS